MKCVKCGRRIPEGAKYVAVSYTIERSDEKEATVDHSDLAGARHTHCAPKLKSIVGAIQQL